MIDNKYLTSYRKLNIFCKLNERKVYNKYNLIKIRNNKKIKKNSYSLSFKKYNFELYICVLKIKIFIVEVIIVFIYNKKKVGVVRCYYIYKFLIWFI
jgi:hypothetical protein